MTQDAIRQLYTTNKEALEDRGRPFQELETAARLAVFRDGTVPRCMKWTQHYILNGKDKAIGAESHQ